VPARPVERSICISRVRRSPAQPSQSRHSFGAESLATSPARRADWMKPSTGTENSST